MLRTINDSCEPCLVWIIANLMRFVLGMEVTVTFKWPGAEDVSVKHWGTITNHLITGTNVGRRCVVSTIQFHGGKF